MDRDEQDNRHRPADIEDTDFTLDRVEVALAAGDIPQAVRELLHLRAKGANDIRESIARVILAAAPTSTEVARRVANWVRLRHEPRQLAEAAIATFQSFATLDGLAMAYDLADALGADPALLRAGYRRRRDQISSLHERTGGPCCGEQQQHGSRGVDG